LKLQGRTMSMSTTTANPCAHSGVADQRVSIIIKALNEEKRISATIATALQALAAVGGEVVLADSCSTDRTVELARHYPIRIVQLLYSDERCCGIGPQLGYQHSSGEFVYILDGDMEMEIGFLEKAIVFMADHPEVAGVGGRVVEQNIHSLEYISRIDKSPALHSAVMVDKLDMGGLYRRCAIEDSGYFSDRNLHSYEEFDLALRLRTRGWKLWRLPIDAVKHYGHDAPPYQLLMRRWRSRYVCGLGELIRAAAGQPRLHLIFKDVRELHLYLSVLGWWVLMLSIPFWPLPAIYLAACFLLVLAFPVLAMSLRKRSLARALYAVVSWCFNTAGLIRGFMRSRRPATEAIASRVINEPVSRTPLTGSAAS
jgi:glycosyltransferase involved in cell wall biosynthesis